MKALETGALDYTYPVSKHIQGRVVSARDAAGAVRFLDCGNLPFNLKFPRHFVAKTYLSEVRLFWLHRV